MNDNSRTRWPGGGSSPLDEAIDRAVRDLMSVDPPPGLRRRVMSRLDAGASRRGFGLLQYGLMASASVVLILAVVLMLPRRTGPVQTGTGESARASQAPLATAPVADGAAKEQRPKETASGQSPSSRITRERIPLPRVTNVFGARTGDVSATSEPRAETVWPVPEAPESPPAAVAPLVIAPIEIPALVVAPIVVATPPKGGL
jgi:hypothetical protein